MMEKNKMKNYIAFVITILIFLLVPLYVVFSNKIVLYKGEEYSFKVNAVDPYDMLRGNYIYINFKENFVDNVYLDDDIDDNKKVYVIISKDNLGYAFFDKICLEKPDDTDIYFETSGYYDDYNERFYIETPNKYYMNENKSYDTEKIYDKYIDNTYVKVKVYKGKMVIVGVYINDELADEIV